MICLCSKLKNCHAHCSLIYSNTNHYIGLYEFIFHSQCSLTLSLPHYILLVCSSSSSSRYSVVAIGKRKVLKFEDPG